MPEVVATLAIYKLSGYLYRYYGKKVIILLDEYDTPMQEAYVGGYLNELAGFLRSMFNSTFKTNPWLDRSIMTGFGFTEEEVFAYDSVDELLERAKGKYPSGMNKEGIVIRPVEPVYSRTIEGPLSMKVLNNDYLLKE